MLEGATVPLPAGEGKLPANSLPPTNVRWSWTQAPGSRKSGIGVSPGRSQGKAAS